MAPVRRVVFFVESYFCRRDYERFGVDTLLRRGFAVETWDFTRVLVRGEYHPYAPPDPIAWAGLRGFFSREEALAAVDGLGPSDFVVAQISYGVESLAVFRLLGRRGVRFAVELPALATAGSRRARWRQRLQAFRIDQIPRYLLRRVPEQLLVKPADLGLAWGERSFVCKPFVPGRSERLWVHSLDYDLYLRERGRWGDEDPRLAVFLDQFMPFHSDYAHDGLVEPVAADRYYPQLCVFFDALEAAFGVRITVAAHPRSDYENRGDRFQGREVIRGRTCELVRRSRLVVLHQSTSLGYAVLFRKPLIFAGGRRISAGLLEEPPIAWLASYFGKRDHDLDRPAAFDRAAELRVDEAVYARYQNDYIKKQGSPEAPFWDIVADRLQAYR